MRRDMRNNEGEGGSARGEVVAEREKRDIEREEREGRERKREIRGESLEESRNMQIWGGGGGVDRLRGRYCHKIVIHEIQLMRRTKSYHLGFFSC